MKDGKRTGLRGGEGRDVCVGGLGNSQPVKCGELVPAGDAAGKGTEYTFWRFGDKDSCDLAVAARLASEDFLGILAV